jgi:protein-tyrosine kinase
MRKKSGFHPDSLRPLDSEPEQADQSVVESIPLSGLPLDMDSQFASGISGPPDPILAGCQVRRWTPDPERMISFATGAEPSRGAEELRDLRCQLYRLRDKLPIKTLMVTSALPKEGRSFVALNLANALAVQPHCRVLLIDADLHGPQLHSMLGTSSTPGLSEYLLHEATEFSILQRGPADALFFIPAGRSVPGPTELLGTARLKSLIQRFEPSFDWIIVDSPATLRVSDSGLISNSCDGVILVVRSHSTPFDAVRKARDRFRAESIVGVVLNGSGAQFSSHRG